MHCFGASVNLTILYCLRTELTTTRNLQQVTIRHVIVFDKNADRNYKKVLGGLSEVSARFFTFPRKYPNNSCKIEQAACVSLRKLIYHLRSHFHSFSFLIITVTYIFHLKMKFKKRT